MEIRRYAVMYELNHPANQPEADSINDKMESMDFIISALLQFNTSLIGFAEATGTFLPK